ncbi:MAG: DUF1836 domain-containing protein [Clostridiales bacterium]|nr:DUF1836 domain-containing protein [Clostridiales bacterium]
MGKLIELKEKLAHERPNKWENIPDIDLYMDQVLNYMKRQHIGLGSEEALTSSMVNNYMKKDLLPRARGKKYSRAHIAYLTSICLLKQILPVAETGFFLGKQTEKQSIEQFYEKYCGLLDESLNRLSEEIVEDMDEDAVLDLILKLAVSSYTQKLVCGRLLGSISSAGFPSA